MTAESEKRRYATIRKDLSQLNPRPNMMDYSSARATFDWKSARSLVDGLPDGKGLNIAHEAVDRHVLAAQGDKLALRWIGRDGFRTSPTRCFGLP